MSDLPYRTPGQLIQSLLDDYGWTQVVLAIILGVDKTVISKLIAGKKPLDADLALKLGEVFKMPAETFMELQKRYDLAQAEIKAVPDQGRATRAHLFGGLPIAEMIKRGWLPGATDIRDVPNVEKALIQFFKAGSLDEIEVLPHAAKKTNVFQEASPVQLAWVYRVREIASEMLVAPYSPAAVSASLPKLKELLVSPAAARKVPRILAECGIRFVIVESLPGAKIDGVCLWLDDKSPVIGMSIRYDRIDNFWFVLRHEMEHVIQGHGKVSIMLDTELEGDRAGVGDSVADEERIANLSAAEFCVPKKSLDSFVARKSPFFKEADIIGFANTLKVHPGLVAGQLQRRINRYELFRDHLVKIRSIVAPGAMVDGWGDVAPVG